MHLIIPTLLKVRLADSSVSGFAILRLPMRPATVPENTNYFPNVRSAKHVLSHLTQQ